MGQPAKIDQHEFDLLNREFYAADPAEVIERRLWMLMRFLGDESTEARYEPDEFVMKRDEAPEHAERVQFATLESTLILHQAAETLLRLYFAHEKDAPCPWAEMTYLRDRDRFPKRVRTLRQGLGSDGVIGEVLKVVSWSGDRKTVEAAVIWRKKGGWTRHREGLRFLFEFACDTVLDGADLYNAGKHGLAILPEKRGVELDVLSVSGPSLTVIESQELEGEPRWALTTRWVDYKRDLVMTQHIASAIRSLWACGKLRRTDGGNQDDIRIFDADLLTMGMQLGSSEGFNLHTMSQSLFDEDHPAEISTPPGRAEVS